MGKVLIFVYLWLVFGTFGSAGLWACNGYKKELGWKLFKWMLIGPFTIIKLYKM